MPIFVAGTGRSGTTVLNQILGEHPDVSAIDEESRFLIDPGGLEDLVDALTTRYTPFHAEDALARLAGLLTRRVTGKEENSFIWSDMPGQIGPDRYYDWVQRFLAALTWYTFDEVTDRPDGGPDVCVNRRVARYYPRRADLLALCRDYVDDLFGGLAKERGKPIWCEKTPYNLLSMPFLWELFPAAKIVHVMRHPLSVVESCLDQSWAPDDVETVCPWIEPIYRRWLEFRGSTALDDRYVEMRLEDLAADWDKQRANLFERLDLPDAKTSTVIEPNRIVHVGRRLSLTEREYVLRHLGFAVVGLGYMPD